MKEGTLVRIVYDAGHYGEYGIVGEPALDTEYQHDYWINLLNGKRAPYGQHEIEVVTREHCNELMALATKLFHYLPEY